MEKRVVIFLVLSIAVILGYDLLLKEFGLLPQSPPQDQNGQDNSAWPPREDTKKGAPNIVASSPPSMSTKQEVDTPVHADSAVERTVTLETNLLRVSLSARGGVITGWELKEYRSVAAEPKPVQLVYQGANFKQPLSLTLSNPSSEKAVREGLFSIDSDFTSLDAAHPVGHVALQFRDGASGLVVTKQLTFHHDSYVVDVAVAVGGASEPYDVSLGTNFGIVEWGEGFIGLIGSAVLVDGRVEKETPDTELVRKGDVRWVALQDKYFIGVLIPE
ncbi:MAG TPA: membrane protein insertase YidC, partial [Nitrospira sp.]|nr:membrane protein insertase YidC [Nitrospira sp.]